MSSSEETVREIDAEERKDHSDEDPSWDLKRTYLIASESLPQIEQLGRLLISETVLEEYYDRSDFSLSLHGVCLFSRNSAWNLRFEEQKDKGARKLRLTGRCLTSQEEIIKFLHSHSLAIDLRGGFGKEELLAAGFHVFQTVQYSQKVFGVPKQTDLMPAKIFVDLDIFGFNFGLVEISVDEVGEIPVAFRTLEYLRKKLGKKNNMFLSELTNVTLIKPFLQRSSKSVLHQRCENIAGRRSSIFSQYRFDFGCHFQLFYLLTDPSDSI